MIPRTLFGEEHALFRDQVRRFIATEITPHHAQWEKDGIVPRSLWLIADKVTAVHAAWAVALALFHRERTGRGQAVSLPMLETTVAFLAQEHLGGAVFEPPAGAMGYAPVREGMRRPFPTRDGFLCFMPYTDGHWRRFVALVDRPDLLADPAVVRMRAPGDPGAAAGCAVHRRPHLCRPSQQQGHRPRPRPALAG